MLDTATKNNVLHEMAFLLKKNKRNIFIANQKDLDAFDRSDRAMYDRLIIDDQKLEDMILSLSSVAEKEDPVNIELSTFNHKNGMKVINKTAPFGTILVVYESRPDVTIEATALSFKSGNKTLLKGGKEARHSCIELVNCWKSALAKHGINQEAVSYLNMNRSETQDFLKNPTEKVDLIVPRGGESLIQFAKNHATAPVLVSGRGNNFIYVHEEANWDRALPIIIHSKISKISACNALDKVLIDNNLDNRDMRISNLIDGLNQAKVEVLVDEKIYAMGISNVSGSLTPSTWNEEFLSMKIGLGIVDGHNQAIAMINEYSGGHSVSILTENKEVANTFMTEVDCAAVYHNVSTRFTDGGAFGMGAELAISTEKLHHRGPLGLQHLVTNKYYIYGDGQIRD